MVSNLKRLNEMDILSQLEKIVSMAERSQDDQPPFGLFTSDGRKEWAQARDELIKGLHHDTILSHNYSVIEYHSDDKKAMLCYINHMSKWGLYGLGLAQEVDRKVASSITRLPGVSRCP